MDEMDFRSPSEIPLMLAENVNSIKVGLQVVILLLLFVIVSGGGISGAVTWMTAIFAIILSLVSLALSGYQASLKKKYY